MAITSETVVKIDTPLGQAKLTIYAYDKDNDGNPDIKFSWDAPIVGEGSEEIEIPLADVMNPILDVALTCASLAGLPPPVAAMIKAGMKL